MSNGAENKTGIAKPADGGFPGFEVELGRATAGPVVTDGMQSQTIGKIAAALAKAQGEIKAPKKGNTAKIPGKDGKSGFEYSYADLADVIESYRPVLSKNEIALVQPIIQRDGHLVLVTRLIHSSGEWIASEYPLTMYQKPQEQGSALTYARRYAVSALLGIAAEDDDDGKRAQDAEPAKKAQPRKQTQPDPEWEGDPKKDDAGAIMDLALVIAEKEGRPASEVIRDASKFNGSDGKERSFTDPNRISSEKWLAGTRRKLEDAHRERLILGEVDQSDVPF